MPNGNDREFCEHLTNGTVVQTDVVTRMRGARAAGALQRVIRPADGIAVPEAVAAGARRCHPTAVLP